jgi:hypothetical protein
MLLSLMGIRLDGTRESRAEPEDAPAAPAAPAAPTGPAAPETPTRRDG